jgi:hypothetical protein
VKTALLEMKMATMPGGNNDALKKALTQLGWTQSDLAHRSNINLSTIADIINLANHPTKLAIKTMAP